MKGSIERLAPFRDLRFLRGGPFVHLFNCGLAGIYDREKFSGDNLELWFIEIRLKCRAQLRTTLLSSLGQGGQADELASCGILEGKLFRHCGSLEAENRSGVGIGP